MAAVRLDELVTHHVLPGVIPALDQHVWANLLDQWQHAGLVEQHHVIHVGHGGQDAAAHLIGVDGPAGSLELAGGLVAVQALRDELADVVGVVPGATAGAEFIRGESTIDDFIESGARRERALEVGTEGISTAIESIENLLIKVSSQVEKTARQNRKNQTETRSRT